MNKARDINAGPEYRDLPNNLEAEQALLGALLVNNDAYARVADFLKPYHFSEPLHERLFEAIAKVIEKGGTADPMKLKRFFEDDDALKPVGGTSYIVRLAASGGGSSFLVTDLGKTIKDLWKRREIIISARQAEALALAEDPDRDGDAVLNEVEQEFHRLHEFDRGGRHLFEFGDAASEAIEHLHKTREAGGLVGVPTGLKDLDRMLGGFLPGQYILLGGRPGIGKTVLLGNFARAAAQGGYISLFFSIEQDRRQLVMRMLSDLSHDHMNPVSYDRALKNRLSKAQIETLDGIREALGKLPVLLNDRPRLTVTQLRLDALMIQRKLERKGLRLGEILVDYLQLVKPANPNPSRYNEVSEISAELKLLARELQCPVVAACQLSRAVEQRDDKRPQLSDLRDSGTLEQDADVILFPYREAYYLEKKKKKTAQDEQDLEAHRNQLELDIAKQRNGPVGRKTFYFQPETGSVRDLRLGGDGRQGGAGAKHGAGGQ